MNGSELLGGFIEESRMADSLPIARQRVYVHALLHGHRE